MVRRVAAIGTPEAIALLVEAVGEAETDPVRLTIVEGLNEALKGRRQVAMPAAWPEVFAGAARERRRPSSARRRRPWR